MSRKAFILIQTDVGKTKEVSNSIKQIDRVKSVDVVTGPYDVIAVLEAEEFTDMWDIVTTKISPISGVDRWIVCAEQ